MHKAWIAVVVAVAVCTGAAVAAWTTMPSGDPGCASLPPGPEARACYVDFLRPKASEDLAVMFVSAAKLLDDPVNGQHFAVECHEVMHDLGKALEAEFGPLDITETPTQSCANGFQHGVAEHRLGSLTDAELQKAGKDWCTGQEAPVCRHLLGHVAMRRTLTSAAAPDPTYALAVCDVPDDPSRTDRENHLDEFRCLDGAYMEWSLWVSRTEPSSVPSPPELVCRDLREESLLLASACVSQVGILMHGFYPSDRDAVRACDTQFGEISAAAKKMCVYSVTNSIATLSGDPVLAARGVCDPDDIDCLVGMVMSLVATRGDDAARDGCNAVVPKDPDSCVAAVLGEYPFEF